MNPIIFGRSYQDGYSYYNLGEDQWFHNFYVYSNPDLTAGVVNIDNASLDTHIYTSPYPSLQKQLLITLPLEKAMLTVNLLQPTIQLGIILVKSNGLGNLINKITL